MRSTRRPISRNPILAIMLEMWPCLGPKVMALFLYLVQPRLLLSRERGLRKGSTIFLNWRRGPILVLKFRRLKWWTLRTLSVDKRRVILRHLSWRKSESDWHVRNKSFCCWIVVGILHLSCVVTVAMWMTVRTVIFHWLCIWIPRPWIVTTVIFKKLFLMSVLIARVVRFAIMGLGHRRLMINWRNFFQKPEWFVWMLILHVKKALTRNF